MQCQSSVLNMTLGSLIHKRGKWKSKNLGSWNKFHLQIWPAEEPPTLLVPLCDNRIDRGSNSAFMESTIPTKLLFSSLCAHSSQPKSNQQYRFGASRMLFELLCKCISTNTFKLEIALPGGNAPIQIPVPPSGMFPSAALIWGDERAQRSVAEAWNRDSEDWGLPPKKVEVKFVLVQRCATNLGIISLDTRI